MIIQKSKFKGLFIIKPNLIEDKRGTFRRFFCAKEFRRKKIIFNLRQSNISENVEKHTLRGFHYQQKPYGEDKIITCIKGAIYNVVLDLRTNSRTFKKWISIELSESNRISLFIPKGCANAWLTLKKNTTLLYLHSEYYNPNYEQRVRYNDPMFSVNWPHKPKVISFKDKNSKNYSTRGL